MRFNQLEVGQKFKIAGDEKNVYFKGLLHSNGKVKAICLNDGHIYDIDNQRVIPMDYNKDSREKIKIIVAGSADYPDDSYLSVTEEQMRLLEYLENNGFITLKGSIDDFVEVQL